MKFGFGKNKSGESLKDFPWWRRYLYPVVSVFLFIGLVAFLIYSFVFLVRNLNRSFTYSAKKKAVHFNLEKLKEIENKIPKK